MPSILVAGDPSSHSFVLDTYGDLALVTFARDINHALAILKRNPPSILIGTLTFDDSGFLPLIPIAKAGGSAVVVVDCPHTVLRGEALDHVMHSARLMGMDNWFDMRNVIDQQGIAEAASQIRMIVQQLLAKLGEDAGVPEDPQGQKH